MNIRDLCRTAKGRKLTEEDIQALKDRLRARQQEWEKQELEQAKRSKEFLERTYTL